MPKISTNKKEKISEYIISLLFDNFPKPLFTSHIAKEIARDEEFTRSLLQELTNKQLIVLINKNSRGKTYKKRARWRLSTRAHTVYTSDSLQKSL